MNPLSLFDQFIATENFVNAFQRLALKKSAGGIDKMSVEVFGQNLEKNILKLQKSVIDNSYVPEPVTSTFISKYNKKNDWRELGLPTVADKLVQTAFLQVVSPVAEKIFSDSSYGYRLGKGPHKALRRVEHLLNYGKLTWVAANDLHDFFGTLNHARLFEVWKTLLGEDGRLINLIKLWCRMGIVGRDGSWRDVESGVRQGLVIAPLLANLYLHDFDMFILNQGWGYIRYADDFLVFCRDEKEIIEANEQIRKKLNEIQLSINEEKKAITSLQQGFTFLGVQFQGVNRRIDPAKLEKMHFKLKKIFQNYHSTYIDIIDNLKYS